MRFLTVIKMDESFPAGPPPQALFEAIGNLVEEQSKDGTLLDTGGLYPTSEGVLVTARAGQVQVIDGPFAEAKEVIGGWAMFQLHSKEEAIEQARRFMQLHLDLWPGFEGTCEVRQVMEQDDFDPSR
jgi:hypothetical protein